MEILFYIYIGGYSIYSLFSVTDNWKTFRVMILFYCIESLKRIYNNFLS